MNPPLQTIASDRLTVAVSPDGAQMVSLKVDGREWLWRADPTWWPSSAPILFPIVGGLNGDAYRVDGHTYALPRHGFARRSLFALTEATADRAAFRLQADAATRAVYPFDFRLDLAFQVSGARLDITATLSNRGAAPLPASFGFHPAFNWPLEPEGDKRSCRIVFDAPEPEPIRRLTLAGLIQAQTLPTPVEGRVLALRDELFDHDALIFDQPTSRGLVYGAPGGPGLRLTFPDMPQLGVWTKPGAPFICIEPWQGMADPVGFTGDLRDKPGVIEVAAGAQRVFAMSLAVVDIPPDR
jgi:galactose mutarotase-like enzyme